MLKLQLFDLAIVAAYLIVCLLIGLHRAYQIKTLKQFATGYKNISTTVLVCIIFASAIGAGSTLGTAEKVYLLGSIFVIRQLFKPLCWLIAAKIFAPNIEQFRGCISISQVMYKLYGAPGRWITNFASVIMSLVVVAAQALAIGYVFHYFLGIEVIYGIAISYGILTLYSALGGIRAIILTEVFQFAIFLLIIPISYIFTLTDIDGIASLIQKLPESHLNLELNYKTILSISSLMFYTLLPSCDSTFIQRCLLATSSKELERSLKSIALISLPFYISICLIAYIVRAASPDINQVFLYYISNLPTGLKGVMVAGIIAIIMSMAEAWLNSTSVIVVNDMLKVLYPNISNRVQIIALRISVIILSVLSVTIISKNSNTLSLIWLVDNFWVPIITIPLSAGFLGLKTSSKSFIVSTIVAVTFTVIGRILTGEFAVISLSLGVIGSAVGLFTAHLCLTEKKAPVSLKVQKNITQLIKKQIYKAKDLIKPFSIKEIQHKVYGFCTFTLGYYFIYTFNLSNDPMHKTLSYLLVVGYILCFVMLLKDAFFSTHFQHKYLSLYWYCIITFCLPLVASYMLFVSQGDDFWIINGLLSAFSLYFFVDAITGVILLSIGIIGGYVLFSFSGLELKPLHIHTAGSIGYIYLFFLFASLVFLRKREKDQQEKVDTMQMLGGAIAHEVKSPMSSIIMSTQFLNDVLGKTMDTVEKRDPNKYIIAIDKKEYELLMQINQSVQALGFQGLNTIDSILASLRSSVIGEKKLYSIKECLNQVISEYSMFSKNKNNIEINIKNNFKVKCSLHYVKHVFFNLIKNAYKYGGENVKIEIWTKGLNLHFKDYGKGISSEDLPHIFDKFYTKTGTGIGLAFCKMVMEDLGGSIECKSELGKYTEFTLKFPNQLIYQ